MIRANQRFFNLIHVISDGIIVFFSFVLAYFIRFGLLEGETNALSLQFYFQFALVASALQVTFYAIFHLYSSQRKERFRFLAFRLLYCNLFAYMTLLMGLFWTKQVHFSRMTLALFFVIETTAILSKRFILLRILHFFRSRGYNQRHILLVGDGTIAQNYLAEIFRSPELGYQIKGYVSPTKSLKNLEYLGNYQELEDILDLIPLDEVVVAMPWEDYGHIGQVIEICEKSGTKLSIIPFYTQYFQSNPKVDYLHQIPLLQLRPIPLEHFGWSFVKRLVDVFGSIFLLILLSPLLICTAIGVKLSSKGPIIFAQNRAGLNKKEFKMYKFRSMVVNPQSQTAWSQNTDPRKTKFGTFIRKCSIDELPQLWNVLRGDMSLVGPRPEIPYFIQQFKLEIPHYMAKHHVKPGITGWAQVNGFRGDTSIEERIRHDMYYIEHWTLWFDLKILILTLFKGVFNEEK